MTKVVVSTTDVLVNVLPDFCWGARSFFHV